MKKKIVKRRSYKVGMEAYFNDWNESTGSVGTISKGIITNVTTKFCMIDVNGVIKRKTKQYVYFSEDDLKMKIIQESNDLIIERHGMDLNKLFGIFNTMSEKYPENFV